MKLLSKLCLTWSTSGQVQQYVLIYALPIQTRSSLFTECHINVPSCERKVWSYRWAFSPILGTGTALRTPAESSVDECIWDETYAVAETDTVGDLKALIFSQTTIPLERQKILNLSKGKLPEDETVLSHLNLREKLKKEFTVLGTCKSSLACLLDLYTDGQCSSNTRITCFSVTLI